MSCCASSSPLRKANLLASKQVAAARRNMIVQCLFHSGYRSTGTYASIAPSIPC